MNAAAPGLDRITVDPDRMGGRACIRDLRITVAAILRRLGNGAAVAEILADYPDLAEADIRQAILYGALLAQDEIVAA